MKPLTLDAFRKLTAKLPGTATLVIADDDVGLFSTPLGDVDFGVLHPGLSMACLQKRPSKKTNVVVFYRIPGGNDDPLDEADE